MISGELEGLLGDPPLLEGEDPDLYGRASTALMRGEMFSALNLSDIDADAKLRKPGQTEGLAFKYLPKDRQEVVSLFWLDMESPGEGGATHQRRDPDVQRRWWRGVERKAASSVRKTNVFVGVAAPKKTRRSKRGARNGS
jgi:hypothetical protein